MYKHCKFIYCVYVLFILKRLKFDTSIFYLIHVLEPFLYTLYYLFHWLSEIRPFRQLLQNKILLIRFIVRVIVTLCLSIFNLPLSSKHRNRFCCYQFNVEVYFLRIRMHFVSTIFFIWLFKALLNVFPISQSFQIISN